MLFCQVLEGNEFEDHSFWIHEIIFPWIA
jgi:hypothetical protein